MRMTGKIVRRFLSLLLVSVSILAGSQAVATAQDQDDSAATRVRERAEQRWQAMIQGNFGEAYGFESPAFREVYSEADFWARFGNRRVTWTSAEVTDVQFRGEDVADVRIMVQYRFADPMGQWMYGQRPLEESWIQADGQWWHVTKK